MKHLTNVQKISWIFIITGVIIGSLGTWTEYDGVYLLTSPIAADHETAEGTCKSNGGVLVYPFWDEVQTAVIDAAITLYPVEDFWTGFKRNSKNDLIWTNLFYHASGIAIPWQHGTSSNASGDCLEMKVLSTGIEYRPADCGTGLHFICHQLSDSLQFDANPKEYLFPDDKYFTLKEYGSEGECSSHCLSDLDCIGYSYSPVPDECATFTSFSNSTETDYIVGVSDINATICCSLGGTVVVDCCMVNDTAMNANCLTTYGGTYGGSLASLTDCRQLSDSGQTIRLPFFRFDILERRCVIPGNPPNGTVTVNTNGDRYDVDCDKQYSASYFGNITCGADFKWTTMPYCKHKAQRCPPGWIQHLYSCYLVDPDGGTPMWRDLVKACGQYNAFPLHVGTEKEANFVDRLLYFNSSVTFWTGVTSMEGYYRFAHSYQLTYKLRWYGKKPSSTGCVTLERVVDGVDYGRFYNNITSCTDKLPYICKMGSSVVGGVCNSAKACRGHSRCSYYGKCKCWTTFHTTMIGQSGNNMTFCAASWKGKSDYSLLETSCLVPWTIAVSLCKDEGGSLYSPLTQDLEAVGMQELWISGYGKSSWTGLYTLGPQTGHLFMTGFLPVEIVEIELLSWRNPPTFGVNETQSCVAVEISKLGARLFALSCNSLLYATCFKYNDMTFSPFVLTDNTMMAWTASIDLVLSSEACGLECLYASGCHAFTYHNHTNVCYLYNSTDDATTADNGTVVHRKIAACSAPFSPWHGASLSDPGTGTGTVRQYQCDSEYIVPPTNYTDTLTCLPNGRWSQIPMCITAIPRCPVGWEQYNALCYFLSDDKISLLTSNLPWYSAHVTCLAMDSVLLQLNSREELDFVSQILNVDWTVDYWTGGNDLYISTVYSWSTNKYSEMKYKPFPGPEDGLALYENDDQPNCLSLSNYFNNTYTVTSFLVEKQCSIPLRYVCLKKVVAVGSYNCSQFIDSACPINSKCVENKCVCVVGTFQIGPDGDIYTKCKRILALGSTGCYVAVYGNIDELCQGDSSICVLSKCQCRNGTFQNGPDQSPATSCETEWPPCPSTDWLFYDNHCYSVLNDVFIQINGGTSAPPCMADYTCGIYQAHLATIHSEASNRLLMLLGKVRSERWIGYHYSERDVTPRWVDNSTINFTLFGITKMDFYSDYCTYMDQMGYWRKTFCQDFTITDVMCERSASCRPPPIVTNGSCSSDVMGDVGTTYTYTCDPGFVLNGSHSGAITCKEVDRESVWTDPPICESLLDKMYVDYTEPPQLYGLHIDSVSIGDPQLCAAKCLDDTDCSMFILDSGLCTTYSNKSVTSQPGLTAVMAGDVWIRNTSVCDPVPYVSLAHHTVTGSGVGSEVTYRCDPQYRVDRATPNFLTCNDEGHWDKPPPVCISRFEREIGARSEFGKAVYKIYNISECEAACMDETEFRCMRCFYYHGVCYLFPMPFSGNRGEHYFLDTKTGVVVSELIDSDLEEFDLWYHQTVDLDIYSHQLIGTTEEMSAENCAQECIYSKCTFFSHHRRNLTCSVFEGDLPNVTPVSTDADSQVYKRRYVCGPLPNIVNASIEVVLQQIPGVHSIGDQVQVECLVDGQERVNHHNGQMECQKTGHWSSLPACRNLCQDGWYMKDYICYKLYASSMTFWDAYEACHEDNAGLVNLQMATELQTLSTVWNWSDSPATSYWLGAYSDLSIWRWSERLGGDVSVVLPSLPSPTHTDQTGVVLDLPSGTATPVSVTDTNAYICQRAAGKLVCPEGWVKHQSHDCLKVFTDTPCNYAAAITACEDNSATLASVHSVFVADVIGSMVKDAGIAKAFVGLHKLLDGMYKSNDGTRLMYTFLMTLEARHADEQCATIAADSLVKMAASSCTSMLPFVCKKSLDEFGEPTDFSDQPCSTDNYCNDLNLRCVGLTNGISYVPPKCTGISCPPPWVYMSGRCYWYTGHTEVIAKGFLTCGKADGYVFVPNDMIELYNVYFWLQPLVDFNTVAIHVGFSKNNGPENIAMDTKRPPTFPSGFSSTSFYHQFNIRWNNRGKIKGTPHLLTAATVCEKEPSHGSSSYNYDYVYEGCYNEETSSDNQDLSEWPLVDGAAMTVDACAAHCRDHGYKYCGITGGNTCRCGNSRGRHGRSMTINCNIECPGNSLQTCGGTAVIEVYRTTASACTDSMPTHPFDPSVCYVYVNNSVVYGDATMDCVLQGGTNSPGTVLSMENPVVEEVAYNQVFSSILRPSSTWSDVAWIGLVQQANREFEWSSGIDVDWAMFYGADQENVFQFGVITNLTGGGFWEQDYVGTSIQHPYACQLTDNTKKITGDNIQQRYALTRTIQTVRKGDFQSAREFEYGCLGHRDRCPHGFTIMMWIHVQNVNSNHNIMSAGDCMTDKRAGAGFCMFYVASNQSLVAIDMQNHTCKRFEMALALDQFTHLALYFVNETEVYVYVNGSFVGTLEDYTAVTFLVAMDVTKIHINYDQPSDLQLENVTFIAGPPDDLLLQLIRDNASYPSNRSQVTDQSWKDFNYWGLDISLWGSAGADGDGLSLPHKSFTYELGQVPVDWIEDPTQAFTLALWLKLHANGKEDVDILTLGGGTATFLTLWYDASLSMVQGKVVSTTGQAEMNFSVSFDEWHHIAITAVSGSMVLYLDGQQINTVIHPAASGLNFNYTMLSYAGSAVCPLGWTSHALSCYYKGQSLLVNYWDQEQYCQQLGGHLVTVDNDQEMAFIQRFLFDSDMVYTGVFNEIQFNTQNMIWFNTRGYQHKHIFFSENRKAWDYNFVSMHFDPFYNISVPSRSGKVIQDGNMTGNMTNMTDTESEIFYGVTPCEINLSGFRSRMQVALRCRQDWYYWNDRCYRLTGPGLTVTQAVQECNKHRAALVQVRDRPKHIFLSNWIQSAHTEDIVYIGLQLRQPLVGNASFVWSDMRPLSYSHWLVDPGTNPPGECVVMDCSGQRSCPWRLVTCDSLYPAVCERASDTLCGPGWSLYKDKCVSSINVTSAAGGRAMCSDAGAVPLSLTNKADTDEYIYTFGSGAPICMTDGMLNDLGEYKWQASNTPAYFTGQTLPGSGDCVGLDDSGPVRLSCNNFDCIICQHYVDVGISVDNIHMKTYLLDSAAIQDIYRDEGYTRVQYVWDMGYANQTNDTIEGSRTTQTNDAVDHCPVFLNIDRRFTITRDPTLGDVLQITTQGPEGQGASYNLSDSDDCLQNIVNCKQGITVMFWVTGTNVSDCTLVDTMADGSTGLKVWIGESGKRLHASVTELNYVWGGWIWVVTQDWIHIAVTWQTTLGLRFHTNFRHVYTVTQREILNSFSHESVSSSELYVGACSNPAILLLNSLQIFNYALASREVAKLQKNKGITKVIDFNVDQSATNVNLEKNSSLTSVVWRNSLFQTAVHVDNPAGLSPAMYSQQLPHCFTRSDLCSGPFTMSLWLRPMYMESDQEFLSTGTKVDVEVTSLKIRYDSYADKYILEVFYDKTLFTIEFYLDLYQWSHLVINGDFTNSHLLLFVNGQPIATTSTAFIVDRMLPQYDVAYLNVGTKGTFDIDDIQYIPAILHPSKLYVLKSCREYELAGFRGIQQLRIDLDPWDDVDVQNNQSCYLNDYNTFHFTLDELETLNTSYIALEGDSTGDFLFTQGVLNEAIFLNSSGLVINITDELCFRSIAHCYFGFTVALWVRLDKYQQSVSEDTVILLRMGGHQTNNESGVVMSCSNTTTQDHSESVVCSVSLVNHTLKWMTMFHIQYKKWSHLALTWNPYHTLKLYKNGHLLSDLGSPVEVVEDLDYSFVNQTSDGLCVGCSIGSTGVVMAVDEMFILEMDISRDKVRKLYGIHHQCSEDWRHESHTDKCYHFSTTSSNSYDSELVCQSSGGNLADEVDLLTHQLLIQMAGLEGATGNFYLNYKQMPRLGVHAIRTPDGGQRNFTTFIPSVTTTRTCGMLSSIPSWCWASGPCSTAERSVCQANPWYTMAIPLYLNHSVVSPDPDLTANQWTGHVDVRRGVTLTTMTFNNTHIYQVLSDRCLVNRNFCHNGLTMSFWLLTCYGQGDGETQLILTTMENQTSYGIAVYLNGSTTLMVDLRTETNFTRRAVSVSVCRWTHVAVSLDNITGVAVFVNGREAEADLTYDDGDTAERRLGEEVYISVGSRQDGGQGAVIMLDNMTITEHQVLDVTHLHSSVYDNFPALHLSLDNHTLILPTAGLSNTAGWHGDCLTFSGDVSSQFEGQLYQDCMVTPDLCLEGFTLSIWLNPSDKSMDQGILSSRRDFRGLAMAYYVSYSGLLNKYWIVVQQSDTVVSVPYELYTDLWSNVMLTWYKNGSIVLYVNGVDQGHPITVGAVTTGDPPQPTNFTLGAISGYNDMVTNHFLGSVDEIWFRPRPLMMTDMLEFYKNSTYVRTTFVESFDAVPSAQSGGVVLVPAVYQNGCRIISGLDWINLTDPVQNQSWCVLDIDRCVHGLTISLYLYMDRENDTDQVIFTSGGHNTSGLGIALLYTAMNKSLPFRRYFEVTILTTSTEYRTWFNLQWHIWNYVTITFHPMFGVRVYVDEVLSSLSDAGSSRDVAPTVTTQHFLIGQSPATGSPLGYFAVDQLQILDRALFEGDHNSPWRQYVHADLQMEDEVVWRETTRDECHHICDGANCSVFAFCDDRTFGACVVYPANVTSNVSEDGIEYHSSCDLFVKIDPQSKAQMFGCFSKSELSGLIEIPRNQTCTEDCSVLTDVRYAWTFGNYCYCGTEDSGLTLTAHDYHPIITCSGLEGLIYQITGLRDFLNVTVPITSLDVVLDPGIDVMVDAGLSVTMDAGPDLAYAGFSLNAGDGREIYFTGRNYTTLQYPVMGMYVLEIVALNEISWQRYSIPVYVLKNLDTVDIYCDAVTATDAAFNLTAIVWGGNFITCTVLYGDGQTDSVFIENTPMAFTFYHIYTSENTNTLNVSCYNNISEAMNTRTVVSIHPVVNLTLLSPKCLTFGTVANITWIADRGSNSTVTLSLDGIEILSEVFATLSAPGRVFVNSSIYTVVGIHQLNLTVTNIVSDVHQRTASISVGMEIASARLNTTSQFFRVNDSVSFDVIVFHCLSADISIDFGDGTSESIFFLSENLDSTINSTHGFSSSGQFLVELIVSNCVNFKTDSVTIITEYPVDVLSMSIHTVSDPFDPVKVNLTLSSALTPHPTNAFCVFDLSDGTSVTHNPLVMVDGIVEVSHVYMVHGYFSISVVCHNNVSSFAASEIIQVGSNVTGLSVNTTRYLAQGITSAITLSINTGSLVLYTVDFGDGSVLYNTMFPVTHPNSQLHITHFYTELGNHTLTATAVNSFNTVVNDSVTVFIMEEVTGLIFYGDAVSKTGWTVEFYISFVTPGTDSCIHVSMGDGTDYVFGGANCVLKPEYAGDTYIQSTGSSVSFTHVYNKANTYNVAAEAANEVSFEAANMSVIILKFPCTFPKVNIMGFSNNISRPSYSFPSVALTLRAIADTYCMPIRTVIFLWEITRIDGGWFDQSVINMASLPYLNIPRLSLGYGLYAINITVYMEGFPVFNDTSIVYLRIQPSLLILEIVGGDSRNVVYESPVTMDASKSMDLDFPIHRFPYEITWYCWESTKAFDPSIHQGSPYLWPLESCHPSLSDGAGENTTMITLPATDFPVLYSKTYVVRMVSKLTEAWKSQEIHVSVRTSTLLSMTCKENCYGVVTSSQPVRVTGDCLTCTKYTRLQLAYTWKLYSPNQNTVQEVQTTTPSYDNIMAIFGSTTHQNTKILIQNFTSWTYTGITGANLAIKPNMLEPGKLYELRLESGEAFTTRIFRVTWPPYNGQCVTNRAIGEAYRSKFVVACSDWLDEGQEDARNVKIDQQYFRPFEFTFHFALNTIATGYKMTPFFRVQGLFATAPEVMLCEGDPDNDYKMELVVTVKDQFGGITSISNTVKVRPPMYTALEVTNCTEMRLFEAEKDMMGVLMLAYGVTNRVIRKIITDGENLDHVKVLTAVMGKVATNSDLIQDEVLAIVAMATMSNIQNVSNIMDDLSTETKMQMGNLYRSVLSSLQTVFRISMNSNEKQGLAKDLLRGVVNLAQSIKYDPRCSSDRCDEKLSQGEYAIGLVSINNNISTILLEDTVAGEEEFVITVPQGNTRLYVQRMETLHLLNSTVSVWGQPVVSLDDRAGIVNVEEHDIIDVEIMQSDNLYTTDVSVTQVKSQTTSIALLDVNGHVIHVDDLEIPIKVRSRPSTLQNLIFTPVNLTSHSDANLFYVQVSINEAGVTPVFVVQTDSQNVTLVYYGKVGSPPTRDDYDVRRTISPSHFSFVSNSGSQWQTIIQLSDESVTTKLESSTLVYLGLHDDTDNPEWSKTVQIGLYVLGCLYWNGTQWSRRGLQLGNVASYEEVTCCTTHLTTFGTNVFVPPNTIDFTTVFSKFSADNVAVMANVGTLLVLYFIILVFIRRADKRDMAKWAIYPLSDNMVTDRYHYQMTVYTGMRQNAGTTSKVYFVVGGDECDTEIRAVQDSASRPLTRGSVNNYLLSVPSDLGNLLFLRVWHDNSGKGKEADWFLNMVLIRDLQNNNKYVFLCNQWLAVDKDDGQVERLLPVAAQTELANFDHLFYTRTRQDLTDGHLWVSVLSRPTQSVFTRVQRLSCCLSLLFLTMVTNAMWYVTMDTSDQQNVHLGPFTFSGQELITSFAGSVIVVPVSLIIVAIFKKAERRKPKEKVEDKYEPTEDDLTRHVHTASKYRGLEQYCSEECSDERDDCITPSVIDTALVQPPDAYKSWNDFENRASRLINSRKNMQKLVSEGGKRKSKQLPFWCLYVAWCLVILSIVASGFFVILYSLEWGSEKSSRWLTAFILSFIESVFLIQPLKVVFVALVLILLFRRADDNDTDDCDPEILLPDVSIVTGALPSSYPSHRRPYTAEPPNFSHLEDARQYRKRLNRLFSIFRELGAYIVYLVVVCVLTYENRSKNAYPTYRHLENTFLIPPSKYHASFINISSADYFWNWSHDVLIPGLYSQGQFPGNDSSDYHGYLSDNIHYRVGTPRVRQARVRKDDCSIPREFRHYFRVCYPEYGLDTYDSEDYGEGWTPSSVNNSQEAWLYQTSTELNGYPVIATYDAYGGGGYVSSLGPTNDTATFTFDYLRQAGWIDRNTRAVMVEANIYNPNVNLFCAICLILEFPASGSIIPTSQITPVILYRFVGASALFVLIFNLIFVAFTVYYLIILISALRKEKSAFFKKFWNVIDFLNMGFSITACAFYGVHFIMVQLTTSDFHRNKDAYLNLQYIILWESLFGYMLAFLVFLSMLKLLLLFRFNPKITQLSGTLRKAQAPIASFMVVFIFTFLAFAQFGYLVFGRMDRGYNTFITTLETLMSMLMMKMEIDNMVMMNGLLGSLYVFLFVLVIVFILINMLLSIINDAFTDVRKDPACLPDDPAMVSFLVDQVKAFILGYSKASTNCKEETKEKDLDDLIDDLDLRMRMFIQALHKDKDLI